MDGRHMLYLRFWKITNWRTFSLLTKPHYSGNYCQITRMLTVKNLLVESSPKNEYQFSSFGWSIGYWGKLPLLAIGKFQKPRYFQKSTPPIQYVANKKAWMTATIFVKYVQFLEAKFKREIRKIALSDNCSAHPHEIASLEYLTLYFRPVNTTSICNQWMPDVDLMQGLFCRFFYSEAGMKLSLKRFVSVSNTLAFIANQMLKLISTIQKVLLSKVKFHPKIPVFQ